MDTESETAQFRVRDNNRRMTKNTLVLYIRLIVVIVLNLFLTSQLVLILGIVDYGITCLLGDIVTLFAFLSNTMAITTSRYLNIELGRGDLDRMAKLFSISIITYIIFVAAIFIASEAIGTVLFFHYIDIPAEKMVPAFYFFQLALAAFVLNILTIPYYAFLISVENMGAYSYITILEIVMKVGLVALMGLAGFGEKLQIYGIILLSTSAIKLALYFGYCNIKYKESRFVRYWSFSDFKEIVVFGGWNLWGSVSDIVVSHVRSIMLNGFFGSVVNAANSIAVQVSSGLSSFMGNFMIATRPQIIKYWGADDKKNCMKLAFQSTKLGYFLLLLMIAPIYTNIEWILKIWLKTYPGETVIFTKLFMAQVLVNALSLSLMTLAQASRKIALYQTLIGIILLMNIPIAYAALKLGCTAQFVIAISVMLCVVCLFARLAVLRFTIRLDVRGFMMSVVVKCAAVTAVVYAASAAVKFAVPWNIPSMLLVGLAVAGIIYFIGMDSSERSATNAYAANMMRKFI